MNIFQVVNKLYTKDDCKWIERVDTKRVAPVVVLRFLGFVNNRKIVHKLNRMVFKLEPRHFLYYAWSILPKVDKAPKTKFFKQEKDDKWDWLLDIYADYLEVGYNSIEPYRDTLISSIENSTAKWFSFFGVDIKLWKKYGVEHK